MFVHMCVRHQTHLFRKDVFLHYKYLGIKHALPWEIASKSCVSIRESVSESTAVINPIVSNNLGVI